MRNVIYTLLALILFSSCSKELDIEIPESEKKIVINGILNDERNIQVNISKSMDVLDNAEPENLDSAIVKLYINDELYETVISKSGGLFSSSVFPEPDNKYTITAEYREMKTATTNNTLPEKTQIISVDTLSEIRINEDGYEESLFHFKIKFKDQANKDNFYMIAVSSVWSEPFYDVYPDYIMSDDFEFRDENNELELFSDYGLVFNDEFFDGETHIVDIYKNYYNNIDPIIDSIGKNSVYYIKLYSISSDLYYYTISKNLAEYSNGNPFSQPVRVYTNVENGLGLFASCVFDTDTILILK